MTIKKLVNGKFAVDVRPAGAEGKRFRRRFDTRGEAVAYERHVLMHYHNKEWVEKPIERKALSDLLELWWAYHGKNHRYGAMTRVRIEAVLCDMRELGINRSDHLTRKNIIRYRLNLMNRGIKQSTVNRYCAMMSGFFEKLIDAEEFAGNNPFREIRKLTINQPEMAYLAHDDISRLTALLSGDNLKAVLLCLATGGRWGEIANIKGEHIIGGKVIFMKTKNGSRRVVPIAKDLESLVKVKATGRLMTPNYATVRSAIRTVRPDLPVGQSVHVLRHTFATHFMINGGNIITLQKILGHSTIQQTMTYAHFAPDYLADAMRFNPVANIVITEEKEPAE
ncbi:TPA: tyrosine-type recombinase/integrase [Escherichia coli]|nr:tyrosine-type recombinase/integrase [Escherichia coli]EGI4000406.1 tyrosine-type recombinase/integrase [Escherichia coli]EGI4007897.1 tyrosine-type recombinase/integrase [Escherichia coli]EGI4020128.1 tyrosine-type recombinase/integrase [Escherichia coli]EGI4025161.1 tyrosine-type recombinase/integrase [Escherichia coli]